MCVPTWQLRNTANSQNSLNILIVTPYIYFTMTDKAIIWTAVSSKAQATDDKVSLQLQEDDARAWCDANEYTVIDVLRVPGFSRSETNVETALQEFRAQGITAYDRLARYWQSGDADVMVAYDQSRLGRSMSLYIHVVENTARSGMRIYVLGYGWIDSENYLAHGALGSFSVVSPIRDLQKKRVASMRRRVENGGNFAIPILTHVVGDDNRLIFDTSQRALWDTFAEIFLRGVGYNTLHRELNARGYANPRTNRPFSKNTLFYLLHAPAFWGNTAINRFAKTKTSNGLWCFDPSVKPPAGVVMHYNTCEPVYTGDIAEQMKTEMRRRKSTRGSARPYGSHLFSGLLICSDCEVRMNWHSSGGGARYRCASRYNKMDYNEGCQQRKTIRVADVKAYLDSFLRDLIAGADIDTVFSSDDGQYLAERLSFLESEVTRLNAQIMTTISKQAQADNPVLINSYDVHLLELSERVEALQDELQAVQLRQHSVESHERTHVVKAITDNLEAFWQMPNTDINRLLLQLLGEWRLVVEGGEIIGFREV